MGLTWPKCHFSFVWALKNRPLLVETTIVVNDTVSSNSSNSWRDINFAAGDHLAPELLALAVVLEESLARALVVVVVGQALHRLLALDSARILRNKHFQCRHEVTIKQYGAGWTEAVKGSKTKNKLNNASLAATIVGNETN